jgi:LPS sulfotransferase NodH
LTKIPEQLRIAFIQRKQVPHLQMGYKSYIICTSPRNGSTLLCQLLTNTNVAGVPDSYFHKPSLNNWMEVHGIAPNSLDNRSETLEAVLKKAHKTGPAETGMFGLRLQGGRLNYFMDQLKLLHSEQNSDVERLNTTFGKAAFIFLSRKNKLEQAISCVKAMQTGLWHTALALILQNSSRRSLNHVNQSARNARSSNIKHD